MENRETNYERPSVVDEDGRFKVKVYVPTGDTPYSDYQQIKLNKVIFLLGESVFKNEKE